MCRTGFVEGKGVADIKSDKLFGYGDLDMGLWERCVEGRVTNGEIEEGFHRGKVRGGADFSRQGRRKRPGRLHTKMTGMAVGKWIVHRWDGDGW